MILKIKNYWNSKSLHFRISFAFTLILAFSLLLCNFIIYAILKKPGEDNLDRILMQNNGFGYDPYNMGIDPYDLFQLRQASIDNLNNNTLYYFTISSIVVLIASAFLSYYISKFILSKVSKEQKALRAFVSDASHELRTPLAIIKSQAELLDMKKDTLNDFSKFKEESSKTNKNILNTANQMNSLVDSLLSISRLESSSSDPNSKETKEILNVEEIYREVLENLRITDRQIIEDIDSKPIFVFMNIEELKSVFNNIITNILKYTPEKSQFKVYIKRNRNVAQIVFIDSGKSLKLEDTKHIYDRFWVGDNSRNKEIKGTGLGLSIVKKIIQKNKGTISATLSIEGGLIQKIALPASTNNKNVVNIPASKKAVPDFTKHVAVNTEKEEDKNPNTGTISSSTNTIS